MTLIGNERKSNPDRNSAVKEGMVVNGYFSKKLATAMVVTYRVGQAKRCSGVLHVSKFPAATRKERDKLFADTTEGMKVLGLKVIQVTPPCHDKTYTSVRLSARQD